MPDYKLECVLKFDAEVGEGPAWRAEDQSLYWVDIHKCTINRFHPASGVNTVWKLPAMPGCFVFRDGHGAIIPARDGIYDIDFSTGAITRILEPPYDPNIYRFNDGKCDRQGRLWVGTMPVDIKQIGTVRGTLYRYDGTTLTPCIPIDIANGLAFSPDGKTVYRAESAKRIVMAYDFDTKAGTLSRERLFVTIPHDIGAPDGATVDTDGCYWVALPAGKKTGGIARFTPDGKLDLHIETQIPAPVMINFGGPNMSTLYVTTAQFDFLAGRPGSEMSGSIFAVETPYQGVPEPTFRSAARA